MLLLEEGCTTWKTCAIFSWRFSSGISGRLLTLSSPGKQPLNGGDGVYCRPGWSLLYKNVIIFLNFSEIVFTRWRQCVPRLIHASLYSLESSTQTASRLVQPFLHSSRQRVIMLYSGPPFSPQNCLFTWGSGPPFNTCFLGSTRVHVPNAISTGSAVFAGLTTVTHQQTDHAATSVLWCSLKTSAVVMI